MIRYEDLALDVVVTAKSILSFLGLPWNDGVEEFLNSHTANDVGGVSSTFR